LRFLINEWRLADHVAKVMDMVAGHIALADISHEAPSGPTWVLTYNLSTGLKEAIFEPQPGICREDFADLAPCHLRKVRSKNISTRPGANQCHLRWFELSYH